MSTIETSEVVLPTAWAPVLVHGDRSDLDDAEFQHMLGYLQAKLDGWIVTADIEDSDRLSWDYRSFGGDRRFGRVSTFVCQRWARN